MDTDRYRSLFKRQQQKLHYARELVPLMTVCAKEVGLFASYQEIARWLQERHVPPSAKAKPESKWVAQTVVDYVHCDGIEPNEDAVGRPRMRAEGMRVAIVREFQKVERYFDFNVGAGARDHFAETLAAHLKEIESTAKALRAALGK